MIRLRFAFESFFNVDLIAEVVAIKSFDGASPRLFWPTYAWANVGHPSIPSYFYDKDFFGTRSAIWK